MELYYIPVFIGAARFGLKGSIMTYLFIILLYLPHIYMSWTGDLIADANKLLHLFLQGFFAVFAGFLIDRDKKREEQLEKERYLASIGQAAAAIVHDLKTPLITILGFAKRIREGKGKADSAIQTIIDSAGNMQRIVYDVLDFAKPIQLELKEEDIRSVIRRAYDSCKTKMQSGEINISLDMPDEPVNIVMDNFQLERALVNIINNAIEASVKGQSISISAVPDKNYLSIRIKDQGSGIDRKTLENIFVPFYTKKNKGTGLGMPISKKIIEGHQGRIHIESKPEKGTEVIIRLPHKVIAEKQKNS